MCQRTPTARFVMIRAHGNGGACAPSAAPVCGKSSAHPGRNCTRLPLACRLQPTLRMIPRARFLALLLAVTVSIAATAGAAIVCQHPKRQKQLRLEPGPECAKKGWVKAADLSEFVSSSDLTPLSGLVIDELAATCPGDPSRALSTRQAGSPNDGCRRHDGDPAQCAAAFQTTAAGPASCSYLRGRCYPCAGALEGYTVCTNACRPPSCPAAPGLTYAGSNCFGFDESTCGTRYIEYRRDGLMMVMATPALAEVDTASAPLSCYWNGDYCKSCSIYDQNRGECTNACAVPPACGGRTLASCTAVAAADACAQRFEASELTGLAVSCVWTGSACQACDEDAEYRSKSCTNICP